ncbi:MAG: translesion error-prone DNA polymerase V autoproteolytic subunit [Neisseriaceae bacterium]|jgi:DNA polymerase V
MKLQIFSVTDKKIPLPLVQSQVEAGFPSPAEGYEEMRIDINDIVVTQPDATFYVRVKGNSMIDANISDGDILVVDRSLEAHHNDIVIAVVDGEFTVKTLYNKDNIVKLIPANSAFSEIIFKDGQELDIWGVVSYIIHKTRG